MPTKRTIPRVCRYCGANFLAVPQQVKVGRALYCSKPCGFAGRLPPPPPVTVNPDGLTVDIPLRRRDGSVRGYARVDAADAEWVNRWYWHLDGDGYARRNETRADGRQDTILLHRALLGLVKGDGLDGDHRDRDRLNDTRGNLRIIPKAGNAQNCPSLRGAASSYRGVYWKKEHGKWAAQVRANGKYKHVGYFTSELEAAEAARAARAQLMPYALD